MLMRGRIIFGYMVFALALATGTAVAQQPASVPTPGDIYCSGLVTNEGVPYDTYLISGEESDPKTTFLQGDFIFINKGASQGVKVGDEFLAMRPVKDPVKIGWFVRQPYVRHYMGRQWRDLGKVRVIVVQPNVSIAQIVYACDLLYRGDYLRPFTERPAPPMKTEKVDRFAPASGGKLAMVGSTKNFEAIVGTHDVVYVNLGSSQGVKVGDYFRFFRYQGTRQETAYQLRGMAYEVYGFGSAPARYTSKDLPRDILGEGVVLRVSPNAATVLITSTLRPIYLGDYVELE